MAYQHTDNETGFSPVDKEEEEIEVNSKSSGFSYLKAGLALATVATIATFGVVYSTSNSSSSSTYSDAVSVVAEGKYEKYSTKTESERKSLFEDFKVKFTPEYKDVHEESVRWQYFQESLSKIDELNEQEVSRGGNAKFSISKFADRSTAERANLHKSTLPSAEERAKTKVAEVDPNIDKSTSVVSWVDVYTTPVKNQGYCGSCWAFSATEQIESDSIRKGLLTIDDWLSPQQLVSCDTYLYGCDGGDTPYAYYYVYEVGGIETNSSYPYTSYWGTTGTCESNTKDFVVTVSDYSVVEGEEDMAAYVSSTGPLSVCLHADDSWYYYDSGIMSSCGMEVNHCVQAVGINFEESYWVVRNSWGSDWGVSGYIYLNLWNNTCNIDSYPTFVIPATV